MAKVKRLNLDGVAVARPIITLREPAVGYVMELVDDHDALTSWTEPPRNTPSMLTWYRETGGLARRLELAARLAGVLSLLHSRSLVYTDLSPNNALVKNSLSGESVMDSVTLIDADNIVYESSFGSQAFYTPGFAAPEVMRSQSGPNSLTDAHSLAVIAYLLLTLRHPLIGDKVDEGEPQMEQQAYEGQLPWVEDTKDDSNRSSSGLPSDFVLSPGLRSTFRAAFEDGLQNPLLRPGSSKWAESLWAAAGAVLDCPKCGWSFYVNEPECPSCSAGRPRHVRMDIGLWNPEATNQGEREGYLLLPPDAQGSRRLRRLALFVVAQGKPGIVSRRLAFGTNQKSDDEPVVSVSLESDRVRIRSVDGERYRVRRLPDGKWAQVDDAGCSLNAESGRAYALHFGANEVLHRVAVIRLVSAMP